MSLAGYFGRRQSELRMPSQAGDGGVRSDGAVLTGKESVELALAMDGLRAGLRRRGEFARLKDYDPVLRAHCRFDKEG